MIPKRIYLDPRGDAGTGGAGDAAGAGSQAAGGSGTPPGGGAGGAGDSNVSKLPGQNKSLEELERENRFVTKEVLQGAHNALRADFRKELKQSLQDAQKGIFDEFAKFRESIKPAAGSTSSEGGEGKAGKGSVSPEVAELQSQIKALQKANEEATTRATAAAEKEKAYRFETMVKAALQRAGCNRVDLAYRAITPNLRWSEDGKSVLGTMKGEFDVDVDLNVDQYIEKFWRDNEAPELFRATQQRQGGPTGGEGASGDPKYMFTKEQLDDPVFYKANLEKIRYAQEHGLVKGLQKR